MPKQQTAKVQPPIVTSNKQVTIAEPFVKSEELQITNDKEIFGVDQLIVESKVFAEKNQYPIETNLCKRLLEKYSHDDNIKETLEENIRTSYPLIHEELLPLFVDFLQFKNNHGSNVEKAMYKEMTICQLVDR